MRRRPPIRTLAVAGALAVSVAAPASAAKPTVFDDYAPDGVIDPCKHTTAQLQRALDTIPPDVEQYAADYPAALEEALEARARGECGGAAPKPSTGGGASAPGPAAGGTGGAAPGGAPATPGVEAAPTADPAATGGEVVAPPPVPAGAATPAPGGPPDPALERAASRTADNAAPLPVVLLGAIAAAIALGVLASLALRRLGLAGDRLAPAGHAWREAAWRAGGTWADFRDWVRLGR